MFGIDGCQHKQSNKWPSDQEEGWDRRGETADMISLLTFKTYPPLTQHTTYQDYSFAFPLGKDKKKSILFLILKILVGGLGI